MIRLIEELCIGCGACESICSFGGIVIEDEFPFFNEECRLCGECVEICPQDAIQIEEKFQKKDQNHRGILIFGEQRDNTVENVVYELLGKGRELADKLNEPLFCVVLGNSVKNVKALINYGADEVHIYNHEKLEKFNCEIYTKILSKYIDEIKPSIFLIGATSIGRELGPRVAAKLKTGLTADCTGLSITEDNLLLQTRPAFGGNIMASIICPNSRPQMATIRPKVMSKPKERIREGDLIEKVVLEELLNSRVKILDEIKLEEEEDITNANVIISGGMGLGKKEGFEMLSELATILNGTVAASRPTVDAGWAKYSIQVGMSGKVVQPELYIACGISGAVQHKVGMETSDIIVAINKNEEAPIFDIADFGIVADLYDVVPCLLNQLKEPINSENNPKT